MNGDLKRRDATSPSGGNPSGKRHSCRFTKAGTNQGEKNSLQVGAGGGILKDARCERRAVNAAVGCKHGCTEARGNCGNGRAARGFQFVDNIICVNNMNAKLPRKLGKHAFATGNSACQGHLHNYQLAGAGVTPASG